MRSSAASLLPYRSQSQQRTQESALQTRCERETLSRFPRTGAILFTIRTHMRKLKELEGPP